MRGAFLVLLVLCVASIAVAQSKKKPSPEAIAAEAKKFPLAVEVVKSLGGVPTWDEPHITCRTDAADTTHCRESRAVVVGRPYAYLEAQIEGRPALLSCESHWVWTDCVRPRPGPYRGQWVNKQHTKIRLLIYYTSEKEDWLIKQTYHADYRDQEEKGSGAHFRTHLQVANLLVDSTGQPLKVLGLLFEVRGMYLTSV